MDNLKSKENSKKRLLETISQGEGAKWEANSQDGELPSTTSRNLKSNQHESEKNNQNKNEMITIKKKVIDQADAADPAQLKNAGANELRKTSEVVTLAQPMHVNGMVGNHEVYNNDLPLYEGQGFDIEQSDETVNGRKYQYHLS